MIVVTAAGHAAAYDPALGTWRRLPDLEQAPGQMELVWTGTELLVFEWGEALNAPVYLTKYEPATNSWTTNTATPISALYSEAGSWTGREVIFASGMPLGGNGDGYMPNAAYDPSTDKWRALDLTCDVSGRTVPASGRIINQRSLFDPATGSCQSLPHPPNRPGSRFPGREDGGVAVWTGTELIYWSGGTGADLAIPPPADGVAFRPGQPTH